MGDAVWILGGYQSDFARDLAKEGLDFADLTAEVVDATLSSTKLDSADIGGVNVANVRNVELRRQHRDTVSFVLTTTHGT